MLTAFACRFQPFECDELPVIDTDELARVRQPNSNFNGRRSGRCVSVPSACFNIGQPYLAAASALRISASESCSVGAAVAIASDALPAALTGHRPNAGEAHSVTDATQIKAAIRRRFVPSGKREPDRCIHARGHGGPNSGKDLLSRSMICFSIATVDACPTEAADFSRTAK